MKPNSDSERKSGGIVEEITVKVEELTDRIKALIRDGNVRRLVVRTSGGRVLIELPVTAGVFIGSVATIMAPVLVVLTALAGIVTDVKIAIERDDGHT